MATDSRIAWTRNTFNPWIGCTKVSPACDHCYAETLALRRRWVHTWGKDTPRYETRSTWSEPARWHRRALKAGIRERTFCLSLGDLFEEHSALPRLRERLWAVIRATPMLDWLLLTKRPQGYHTMLPGDLLARPNVWPGVTVESPAYTWRLDHLVDVPATGPRWVSYEPALAPVDFGPWVPAVSWIIVGGESGAQARPFDLAWARAVIAQCRAVGVAPFVKQLGWRATEDGERVRLARLADHEDPACWPADLRVREYPEAGVVVGDAG